jgi:methionyl-tRNA formyltransferase
MKIVFMGTPEFALPALKNLIESEHEILAVYSQPPRPSKRGQKEQKSAIHLLAEENNIEVRTPVSLKDEKEQKTFANLGADIAVVVAYGLLLPKEILEAFPHGCINIHPSLLPRWRGAAPIQRTIMAGDKETGVCIIQLTEELDTGDIIEMETYDIPDGTNAGQLHDTLAMIGAKLALKALNKIENGICSFTPQVGEEDITYAKKITKNEAKINWSSPAKEIIYLIRGLNPFPGAYFELNDIRIKILEAKASDKNGKYGEVLDDELTIACGDGAINPTKLQKQGKTITDTESFLRGNPIPVGTCLDTN